MAVARLALVLVALVALLGLPAPSHAQWTGVLGFDGVVSNRTENSFGAALTLAYGHPDLVWQVFGLKTSLKFMGAADVEVVTGALEEGICPPDPYYYRRCVTDNWAVPPELAEAPAPLRPYLAGFVLLDIWRVRLGYGRSGHPGSGDSDWAALLGFAASTTSWVMVELPQYGFWTTHDGWRLRVEMTLAGPEYLWW